MDQLDDSPLKRAPGQSPYGSPQENSAALPDTIDVFVRARARKRNRTVAAPRDSERNQPRAHCDAQSLREDGENGDDSELPFIQKVRVRLAANARACCASARAFTLVASRRVHCAPHAAGCH